MKAEGLYNGTLLHILTGTGLVLVSLAGLFWPAGMRADGCFVAPKFVWDKYKDINEPTQKAILLYDAGQEDLTLQVKYNGPVEQFGWLVPVPSLPTVTQGSMEDFYALSRHTQQNGETLPAASLKGPDSLGVSAPPQPVKVIKLTTVGAYQVAVLSATEPGSLENWLAANEFSFPGDKAQIIDSYVKDHWFFVAIKVDAGQAGGFQLATTSRRAPPRKLVTPVALKLAEGELQPLRISFASDRCVFPLKISSVNGTPSEIQVYVLSAEPLVERRMFEKKFPEIKQAALDQNARRIQMHRQARATMRAQMLIVHPKLFTDGEEDLRLLPRSHW